MFAGGTVACGASGPPVPTPPHRGEWVGKTIVITGASSGFGRGAALRFGAEGGNVVLAARRTELLNEVAAKSRPPVGRRWS